MNAAQSFEEVIQSAYKTIYAAGIEVDSLTPESIAEFQIEADKYAIELIAG